MIVKQKTNSEQSASQVDYWPDIFPVLAVTVAIFLTSAYAFVFGKYGWSTNPDSWGQFGDFMGGLLNPLISLFTLSVAVKVWQLQKTELGQTRNALEDQLKTAEQQRAEARFFDLLNLYQLTLSGVVDSSPVGNANGPIVVRSGRAALQSLFSAGVSTCFRTSSHSQQSFEYAKRTWPGECEQVDHYFRTIFMVLREAEETLGEDHHFRYVKMFRAQLSREELALLAFNMLLDKEGYKMRAVAAKYGILKHLAHNYLREEVEKAIGASVFGRGYVKHREVMDTTEGNTT